MNREALVACCLKQKGASVDQPFGPDADVFKVMGKMFALIPTGKGTPSISLKCDPMLATLLRDTYPAVTPGYHLNKRHWNTVVVDGSVPNDEIEEWIDHSYQQVVMGMTKAQRESLERQDH